MRTYTVTEKHRAVQEGKMAKSEFVRQMRLGYPEHITQWNGYNDTVQILKNRGLLFETAKPEPAVIEEKIDAMKLPYSLEALDRGIRYEFAAAGVEVHAGSRINSEQYDEALKKAKANLDKDAMYYLNLVSGESSNVDKHDKLVPLKRGEGKADVFNGLKKANLRENKEELKSLLKEGKMDDLAEKLGIDVGRLQAAADRLREMEREDAAETAGKVEAMKAIIDEEPDEVMNIDRFGKEKEDHDSNYTKVKKEGDGLSIDEHEYEFFSIIFDKKYNDILEDYMSSESFKQDEKELQDKTGQANVFDYAYKADWENYIREFESINRDDVSEKKGKDHDGDGDVDGDDYMAAKDKAIKKAMGKDEQLKEAIKKIIKSSLLNEAATAKLSDIADKYGDYKGMTVVINDLENIVTDMEGYFAKTRDRVQSAMNKIGQIETPDGMKVGAFLAPAIETAFFKDLNPVRKLSHRDIKLPQVRTISSAEIDAARAAGDIEEQPKQTIFGINEKGEFKLRKDL